VCKQKEKELEERIKKTRRVSKEEEAKRAHLEEIHKKMKKAQIVLYGILNLHDKAVKLALECEDIRMAKEYANKPNELKLKKKLWMKIAKHLFNYQNPKKKLPEPKKEVEVDVSKALEILKDSVLKIDDFLPLFPEKAKVDDLKQHLCKCLDEYNHTI